MASTFDGGPDAWFTPNFAMKGPAWNQGVQEVYEYPNTQEAATVWYHDHALGMTRLNVYMGLAGYYLLRDVYDPDTNPNGKEPANLPSGAYEVPIAIQDRMFDVNGQLLFPSVGINMEHPYWLPEFFGDTILVNGKVWPYLTVDAHRYRFRFLNGSNARFYSLKLIEVDPVALKPTGKSGPAFWQIGTDGGLLDAPVKLNDPLVGGSPRFVFAPGERGDIIIDFAGCQGKAYILDNDAKAPYPNGTPVDSKTTGQIMLFRVNTGQVTDTSYNPASGTPLRAKLMPRLKNEVTAATTVRRLTLNEVMGMGGPLEVLVNNTKWHATVSENPRVGSTEVWEIINLTADTHPIHLHLTQFQLLSRQPFQVGKYMKLYNAAFTGGVYLPASGPPPGGNPDPTPFLQKMPSLPDPNEDGWKDTVRMNPGEVTRIAVRLAPTDVPENGAVVGINQFAFDPTTGPGYVWHCHIIDHEDNEMMRPLVVSP